MEEVSLRSLADQPFELLSRMEQHYLAATAQDGRRGQGTAAVQEWVGIALRLAGQLLLVSRAEVREILSIPSGLARVPGAKAWVRGLANVRGQLLPVIDLGQFLGGAEIADTRSTRVVAVNHREIPAGLLVDEVLGFRRFAEDEFVAAASAGSGGYERHLAGVFRRGQEQWPVLNLRSILESPAFSEVAA
jgi:twitching motility protein PilI